MTLESARSTNHGLTGRLFSKILFSESKVINKIMKIALKQVSSSTWYCVSLVQSLSCFSMEREVM